MKYTAFGLIDFDCTSFRLVILIWGALKTIKTFILIVKWFQECFKSQTLGCSNIKSFVAQCTCSSDPLLTVDLSFNSI